MTVLTEAQLRICAHACITRYDRGEDHVASIIGSYALNEQQRKQVLEMILSHRSDLELDNVENLPSMEGSSAQRETVKWYSSIFRKKTV
ncbi:hypothetical protein ACT3XG_05645 [Paenibacillus polymyxa]|uniref:hypothetical protein n=1 Tax=Paenibacillus TaxID=44249 RepID=UPI0002EB9D78|nr:MULTISPECIES: hypothetical protein [Paenibacillus]AUS25392.1 hypothetical protein C1A50_1207 [Paenibacillus polymyxa]KAE8558305.1 hypothetical protein BJH92_20710 [Paenibacillus polymyxa]KAF6657935.1 hypothetical protein HFD99_07445 [Paenibacillus sp. EKM301P]KJK31913.1 hypothetical protein TY89_04955 [Paenibacillus polymyxa]KKD55460.1 hypothetical protein C400_06480 [Paenibacillus sp. ICGEB2008]